MAVDFAQIQIFTVPNVDSFVKLVTNSMEIKNEFVKVNFFRNFFLIFFSKIFVRFFFQIFILKFFQFFFQANERWSGREASCTIKQCIEVPKPKQGDAECSNGYKFGSLCRYDCNSGYDLEGARENFCGSDGEWSVSEAPNCIIGECSPLDPPVFGDISCSKDNKVGSECTFTCNVGYELLGDGTRLCEDSHLWSGVMPRCVPTECPVLSAPKNGIVVCTAERSYRSICQFKCNDGYELNGNNIMECSAEKKWNPDEAPTCEEILCDQLPPLEHGNVKCSDNNRHQARDNKKVIFEISDFSKSD